MLGMEAHFILGTCRKMFGVVHVKPGLENICIKKRIKKKKLESVPLLGHFKDLNDHIKGFQDWVYSLRRFPM